MNSISDPSRASRGDRKRAQRAIDAAYAAGGLTAADRALRTERVAAAHTVGDLMMLTRDIPSAAAQASPGPEPSLGSAIDPALLQSMRLPPPKPATPGTLGTLGARTGTMPPGMRKFVITVVAVVVGFALLCGLGIVGMVVSTISGLSEGPSTPATSSPPSIDVTTPSGSGDGKVDGNLHSADGWRVLVDAVEEESGTSEIYDAVIYPDYAAIGLVAEKGSERVVFRDGAFLDSFRATTPAIGNRVDLAAIDPEVIAELPGLTAERVGIERPTGAYLIVNAVPSEPRIMVYIQGSDSSHYRVYSLDGTPQG